MAKRISGIAADLSLRFPVNVANFFRTPMFKEHLRWLLLTKAEPRGGVSVKFLDPTLSVNLEYFTIKKTKCRILSISSSAEIKLLPAMTAFKEVI